MSKTLTLSPEEFNFITSPRAVRERSEKIFSLSEEGKTHFHVRADKISETAHFVLGLIRNNYPDLNIPFHSRWEHFQTGGLDRLKILNEKISSLSRDEQVKAKLDLVIVSVLLDAGAGADWSYKDSSAHDTYTRSEALAVASFDMFIAGLFSSDPSKPYQVDATALKRLSVSTLMQAFQVSERNPMVGLEGRLGLLKKLGDVLEKTPEFFASDNTPRPGDLLDYYRTHAMGGNLGAEQILKGLLLSLQGMWPERTRINGTNFGDVWTYAPLGGNDFSQLVCFHKLSQWLSYSLIEPLIAAGINVIGSERLSGLPEYRNGGLFLDLGVLELRDRSLFTQTYTPGSDLIIEWRALTVALLDRTAQWIRRELKMDEQTLPLGKVLQGGTWLAGRATAQKLRGGLPPFLIDSDGTVF